jgi:tRNA(fMet)-specific endonuclease VapC
MSESSRSRLLGTNTVSNLIRESHGRVADRIKVLGDNRVCTSIVVAAELRYGAIKKATSDSPIR